MSKYLDPQNRPQKLKKEIDGLFNGLVSSSYIWPLNGCPTYEIALTPEHYILQQIVYSNPNKKVFNIMDIGAGKFWSLDTLAKVANNRFKDIKFNLIGVRGEPNGIYKGDPKDSYSEVGNCNLYKLGSFACENLINELENNNLGGLIGKIDFIFTNWTLKHLADPVGLIKQMHDCLSDEGIMMYENADFHYNILIKDQLVPYSDIDIACVLTNYLHTAGDEVVLLLERSNQIPVTIIKKHGSGELKLPFNYYDGDQYENNKSHKILLTTDEQETNISPSLTKDLKYISELNIFIGD